MAFNYIFIPLNLTNSFHKNIFSEISMIDDWKEMKLFPVNNYFYFSFFPLQCSDRWVLTGNSYRNVPFNAFMIQFSRVWQINAKAERSWVKCSWTNVWCDAAFCECSLYPIFKIDRFLLAVHGLALEGYRLE